MIARVSPLLADLTRRAAEGRPVTLGVVGFPLLVDKQPRPMSVDLPIAETTTTTSWPARRVRMTWSATARMRSGSATELPPNFCTTSPTGRDGTSAAPSAPARIACRGERTRVGPVWNDAAPPDRRRRASTRRGFPDAAGRPPP